MSCLPTTSAIRTGSSRRFSASGSSVQRTASEDDCESAYALDQLRETGLAYAFSRDGLIVEPMFPHVIAACVEQVVVPYPKLKPFAHPGGALARIAG